MKTTALLRKLFRLREGETPAYQPPIHAEQLIRSAKEEFQYSDWIYNRSHEPFLKTIHENYRLREQNQQGPLNLFIFSSAASNGFYFGFDSGHFSKNDFKFLFEYLKDRALELGYQLRNANRDYDEKGDYVRITERYYLKPVSVKEALDPPVDQRYGNLELEHVLVNDTPSYVKLMAHVYSDRNYQEPLPHNELVSHLLVAS